MVRKIEAPESLNSCLPFQLDLSCMVDDELDESSVSRVLVHLETCNGCQDFLKVIRGEVVVHQHLADPERLARVIAMLEESKFFPQGNSRTHLRRLAAVYFRLGKAYLMLVLDKKYHNRLLEEPVAIHAYKTQGQHFVERMIQTRPNENTLRSYDWVKARYILHGRLENDEENLDKGKMLLEESMVVRPRFAEPRIFLAQYYRYHNQPEKAKELLQWVISNASKKSARASAIINLGVLHGEAGEFRTALRFSRWLLQQESNPNPRMEFSAFYNTAVYYMQLGKYSRAAEYFRALMTKQPGAEREVGQYLQDAKLMREMIDGNLALKAQLQSVSPALVPSGN